MQVIGLCRFSYPAEGGFKVGHETAEERRAYLYAPERMEERFRTFEAITLPGLRAQTDPDFTFLILIDRDLPEPFMGRLFEMVEDMKQAVIIPRDPGPHRAVCQEVLNEARRNPKAPCIQFRMDDDDAVACDFVERVRHDAGPLQQIWREHRMIAIDYNRGFVVEPKAEGIWTESTVLPYYPMGMAMVVRAGVTQSIMNFSHGKVNQFMPTLTFTDSNMYLRGHNGFNDSRQGKYQRPVDLKKADPETLGILRERFDVHEDVVKRLFADL